MFPPEHPELRQLQELAWKLEHPSTAMRSVTGMIEGSGFFPAAWGGVTPGEPLRGRPIMVLGQDQDSQSGFEKSFKKGSEEHTPTWRNLMQLLRSAEVPVEACFFTNFIMGVRWAGRSTGPSPALAHAGFVRDCAGLFLEQLRVQQPRIILSLGMIPFQLLTLISEDLRYRSMGISEFKDLEERDLTTSSVTFDTPEPLTALLVPLCHPSYAINGFSRILPGGVTEAALVKAAFHGLQPVL